MALILLGSLPISTKADSDAINVDYVGWYLANNGVDVGKVALSFDNNLSGKYEITVELMDNDKNVVSQGSRTITKLDKEDKVIIDLTDAPVEIVYYIEVTIKSLPVSTDDGGYWEEPTCKTYLSGKINREGVITENVTAESCDKRFRLIIEEGTTALTNEGKPLSWIIMKGKMRNSPEPPEDANVISLFYEFKPSGATFTPPATLEYHYSINQIPENVDEKDLVIVYWNEDVNEWVKLQCIVDTETKTITAKLAHFTAFAVFSYEVATPPVILPPPEPEPTPPESTPPAPPEPEEPELSVPPAPSEETNWPLIGEIIAGALIVSGISYFVIKRRRAKKG